MLRFLDKFLIQNEKKKKTHIYFYGTVGIKLRIMVGRNKVKNQYYLSSNVNQQIIYLQQGSVLIIPFKSKSRYKLSLSSTALT